MKTLRIFLVMCVMLGFTLPAMSQGKKVEKPMKCSLYAWVIEGTAEDELMAITGNATHLGNVDGSRMTFTKPTATKPPMIEGFLFAANGDRIFFYSYPTLVVTDIEHMSGTLAGIMNFTGGTGRLEGCTGELTINGVFSMSEDYAMWTATGTIKY